MSAPAPQPVAAAVAPPVKPATAHLTNHPQYQLVFEALFRKKHMPLPDKRKILHGISSKIETTTQVESLFTGQSIRPMKEVFKMVLNKKNNIMGIRIMDHLFVCLLAFCC